MTYEESEGWTTLTDPNRRWILMEPAEGERTVSELTETLPVSQPAVSQHLKVLKHVGLERSCRGHQADLPVQRGRVVALRDQLDTFWKRAMFGSSN